MVEKPNKLQPALIGGVIIGLTWSIPFVSLINCACCLGVMIGGALAARLLIKRSPYLPISSGDGALVGLLAGFVGAGVHLLVGVPIGLIFGEVMVGMLKGLSEQIADPRIRETMEQAMRGAEGQPIAQRLMDNLVTWLIISVISVGFATLGGVIGVSLFEKRKGQAPPPYPPGFVPPGAPPGSAPPSSQPPY